MTAVPDYYYNDDPKSFGYSTARSRWPKILTQAIADAESVVGAPVRAAYIAGLELILDQINADATVAPFTDADVAANPLLATYNHSLASLNRQRQLTWQTGPWLYLECHLYAMIEALNLRLHANVDIFSRLKDSTFRQLAAGVAELAKHVNHLDTAPLDDDALALVFREFIDISLWGNATDLSLLAGGTTIDEIKLLQGKQVRKQNEQNILVNDIDAVWRQVRLKPPGRIDIVLDNSGFELLADLCLSVCLLSTNIATEVHLHCKEIPWFVSDTMPKDVDLLLHQLGDADFFPPDPELTTLQHTLRQYLDRGQLKVDHHPFWTLDLSFWHLPEANDLYEDLLESNLIIFKGDLNYRKLTGDRHWDPTTPFTTAIQQLASSKLPVVALRTCKADVVVGLAPGQWQEIANKYTAMGHDGHFWVALGKWAVIEFSPGDANKV